MITDKTLEFLLFGLLGVVFHTLVELNKLNKASNCTFSVKQYFKLEKYSIAISILVSVVSSVVPSYVQQLSNVKMEFLIVPYVAIGYMGQSVLIALIGKANKIVNNENSKNSTAGDVTGVNY